MALGSQVAPCRCFIESIYAAYGPRVLYVGVTKGSTQPKGIMNRLPMALLYVGVLFKRVHKNIFLCPSLTASVHSCQTFKCVPMPHVQFFCKAHKLFQKKCVPVSHVRVNGHAAQLFFLRDTFFFYKNVCLCSTCRGVCARRTFEFAGVAHLVFLKGDTFLSVLHMQCAQFLKKMCMQAARVRARSCHTFKCAPMPHILNWKTNWCANIALFLSENLQTMGVRSAGRKGYGRVERMFHQAIQDEQEHPQWSQGHNLF